MDNTEKIKKLQAEINGYYDKIHEINEKMEQLKKERLLSFEKKYYFAKNYDGGTLIYIDSFGDDGHGFYYANGYFLTFAKSTGYYDDENYFGLEFSDDKMYHFIGCRSYDEVYQKMIKDYKELAKDEFFSKIDEYNQIYLKEIKKLAK